ncbi:hypothetical protein JAAARDRAFT_196688 [Jaapia argillacea MUCL 33604]|uniref:Uncharacterized protein n=1 Tax=Jaapia argillacea MUCL 33604 TaxID=933084 RepID=A0A067PHP9_9AGAM|nr:hypothetical protein JAAARDRAFT_196688 [Jaapia argillacea MUCL 33604]
MSASITAMWAEALLYGAYLPLFLGCTCVCIYTRPDKYLLAISTIMFALCTIEVLLNFATALHAPEIVSSTVCTADVCITCYAETESRVNQINIQTQLWIVVGVVGVVNQLMADGLLNLYPLEIKYMDHHSPRRHPNWYSSVRFLSSLCLIQNILYPPERPTGRNDTTPGMGDINGFTI